MHRLICDCILLHCAIYLNILVLYVKDIISKGVVGFMKKFRACVVGIGFIGAAHIEALKRLPNVEVVALATRSNFEKKAQDLGVARGYQDYREMILREKPDVVHIATPNNLHYEEAMFAMEHGAHVVLEKPLTVTVEEARKLVEYANARGIVNGVNFNCRFYPMLMQLKRMIHKGDIGDIFTVNGVYQQDWLLYDTDYNWRLESDLSGPSRVFADIGSHWIDMAEAATGLRVTEVLADFATFHKKRRKPLKPIDTFSGMALKPEDYLEVPVDTEDYATVLFHFDNGAHGSVTVSQVLAGRKNQFQLAVGGSRASLYFDSEDSNALFFGKRDGYNSQIVKDPSIMDDVAAALSSYPGGHVEGFPDTFKQTFKAIYRAIEDGDTGEHDFARFEDGLRDMQILEAVVQSAREKRWIEVAPMQNS